MRILQIGKGNGASALITDLSGLDETRFTEAVMSEHKNRCGMLCDPNDLRMMDTPPFMCAWRSVHCSVVTAKADGFDFRRPIRLGEIIDIRARDLSRGPSSMVVLVDLNPENATDDKPAISGCFTIGAVDDRGAPMCLPLPDQTRQEEAVP